MKLSFVIPGAPRTKKNHSRVVKAGRFTKVLPSKAHEDWYACALPMAQIYSRLAVAGRFTLPIKTQVNVRAIFYRDKDTGDAVGYYQALADLLEGAGIVENDRLIVSWDGTRLDKDAANPRIDVQIQEAQWQQ